jgi:hypothetical protein
MERESSMHKVLDPLDLIRGKEIPYDRWIQRRFWKDIQEALREFGSWDLEREARVRTSETKTLIS